MSKRHDRQFAAGLAFAWMLPLGACILLAGCEKRQTTPAPAAPAKTITTKTGIEMVLIPAGQFMMGDTGGDDDEKPAHAVSIGGFLMDKYEVTQKAYEALMGSNPSKFKGPDNPVDRVSWRAAIKYCNMRSLKEGLSACYDAATGDCKFDADGYRLPTEAEWEYACRAGGTGAYSFTGSAAALADHGWFKVNSGQTTHPVGQKRANAWGLFDMHGNVAEWCNDRYGEKEYAKPAAPDPRGPAAGDQRILRGGSWRSPDDRCRSAARASETPGLADACFGYEAYGFRCVRRP